MLNLTTRATTPLLKNLLIPTPTIIKNYSSTTLSEYYKNSHQLTVNILTSITPSLLILETISSPCPLMKELNACKALLKWKLNKLTSSKKISKILLKISIYIEDILTILSSLFILLVMIILKVFPIF